MTNVCIFCFLVLATISHAQEPQESVTTTSSFSRTPISEHPPVVRDEDVSSYATQNTVFERIIGLGEVCYVKSQINSYFNPKARYIDTRKGFADLFDWTYIFNYHEFTNILYNKLEGLFNENDFIFEDNTLSLHEIHNHATGIKWVHLLEHHLAHNHILIKENQPVSEIFNQYYPELKQKVDYLKNRFLQAADKKTLYVVTKSWAFSKKEITSLRDALCVCREGNKEFMILYITSQGPAGFDSFENIIVRQGNPINDGWWNEPLYTEDWHTFFNEFMFDTSLYA